MHLTIDLSEIKETGYGEQLETELETTLHSFGGVCCLYTGQSSPVHSPVHGPESSIYRYPLLCGCYKSLDGMSEDGAKIM